MRVTGLALILVVSACGGGDDGGPSTGVTTEMCEYVAVPPTAHAGGTVAAAALSAGAAERVLQIPVGTALGGYTGRAGFLSSSGTVDARKVAQSGTFNPSIGVTDAPRAKALALTTGDETVIILKGDMIFAYEGMLFDIEERLGPEFAGKVILATSHSHSAWAQFTGHAPLKLGSGQLRDRVYNRFLDAFEGAARDALAARVPAKLGIFSTAQFDPMDKINRDRRGENDNLPGGKRGDDHLVMLRVDTLGGQPIAMVPIFGQHPTLNDQDNPFATSDATGALEHALEEQFDSKVVVMHLQSAGGDTSAVGHGGVDCNNRPGKPGDPCFVWAAEEGHGRAAVPELMAAYTSAGTSMADSLEMEMVTRSIETGPFPETFKIRGGELAYAKFDPTRMVPDGIVMDGDKLKSPIDEFNAPVGAALCETAEPMFPAAQIPGSEGIKPYGSCLKLDLAGEILGPIFNIDFGVDATHPVCETTRTTISALRIGDYVFGTLPGEVTILIADLVRAKSPAGPDKTVVIGYSQGHVGYMLRPEDWVLGGYEPSVTFWGPLEAEYIVERLVELLPLAQTKARENAVEGGTTRVATRKMTDNIPIDDPAPMAGTIPATVPPVTWARTGTPVQAQPATTVPRVSGIATFVWFGDDPQVRTPKVTLEYEMIPGSGLFTPVLRKSGRLVEDAEIILAYTPSPLQRSGPQTHVWVAEWQAVPWVGSLANDSLDARGGVPLGRYRFTVAGKDWTISSNAFEVVQGGVTTGTVTRTGGNIRTSATWFAPKGWRLMDMNLMSNQNVPVRSQTVTVTLRNLANVAIYSDAVMTDANGVVTVPDNPAATTIQVTDRFGNVTTASVP
jgi:neutral ceramidase